MERESLKHKLLLFLAVFLILSVACSGLTAWLDPFFIYHAPREGWYYRLSNERSQSIGAARYLDYDALIVGSSLIRDIRTSRFDEIYHTRSIKLPISGATWHETGEVIRAAFESGRSIRMVLRPLDVNHLIEEADWVRGDLGEYPYYLYDQNHWNDVRYLCNRDILLSYCFPMIRDRIAGIPGGHTPFDRYGVSYTSGGYRPPPEDIGTPAATQIPFTEADRKMLDENLDANLFCYAEAHPDTEFILYLPPYSVVWWSQMLRDGVYEQTMDATVYAVKRMLPYPNIRVYCYDDRFELTDDLMQYADEIHYSDDVTHQILEWIAREEGRLTRENAEEILGVIRTYYREYDYEELIRRTTER